MLSSALFSLSFVDKKILHSLDVSYNKTDFMLVVSGAFPKGTEVKTEIDSMVSKLSRVRFYIDIFKIQENGLNQDLGKITCC